MSGDLLSNGVFDPAGLSPVFVVGYPRSGTTLLFRHLASSGAFGSGPSYGDQGDRSIETAIGFFANPFVDRRAVAARPWPHWRLAIPNRPALERILSLKPPPDPVRRGWERLLQFALFRDRHLEPERIDINDLHQRQPLRSHQWMRARHLAMRMSRRRAIIRAFVGALAQAHGTKRSIEKYPFHYLVMPELLAAFPSARFVFISRRPETVFRSMLRRLRIEVEQSGPAGATSWLSLSAPAFADDWNRAAQCFVEFRGRWPHAILHLRYEELVENPVARSRDLTDFLGIPPVGTNIPDTGPDAPAGSRFVFRGGSPRPNDLAHLPDLDAADLEIIVATTAKAAAALGHGG